MGKASEAVSDLKTPLTPKQIRARKAAQAVSDPGLVATLAGTLEKPVPAQQPRVVKQSDRQTWD